MATNIVARAVRALFDMCGRLPPPRNGRYRNNHVFLGIVPERRSPPSRVQRVAEFTMQTMVIGSSHTRAPQPPGRGGTVPGTLYVFVSNLVVFGAMHVGRSLLVGLALFHAVIALHEAYEASLNARRTPLY